MEKKKIQPVESRYVFYRLNGMRINRVDSAWRRICEIAGIPDFHYHDLGHTLQRDLEKK